METKSILGVVLSFGVAFALLAGAGVGAVFNEDPRGAESTRTLGDIADDASVDREDGDGLAADVGGDNEPTLVGVLISGGQFIVQLVIAVALLPGTLMDLGFPEYFATTIGNVGRIIAFIGLVQFVGRTELI